MSGAIERRPEWRRQVGFALLVTLLVLVIGATTLFVSSRGADAVGMTRATDAALTLARARKAVITYAQFGGANNKPGALPCPDISDPSDPDDEDRLGEAGAQCQGAPDEVYIGRLPWRTVDLARSFGNKAPGIWYAIDGDFSDDRDIPPASPVNRDTSGELVIGGESYAAVLIIAGDPMPGQTAIAPRPGIDRRAYLESSNVEMASAAEARQFIDCVDVDGCNDRVIGIKANALLARVPILVLEDVGAALEDFYDDQGYYPEAAEEAGADTCTDGVSRGRLPVGAEFGSPGTPEPEDEPPPDPPHTICDGSGHLPDWIDANGWNDYVYYAVSTACAGTGSDCAGADSSDLLSLDGESGHAVVFGVPPDLNAYSNAQSPADNDFETPGEDHGWMRGLAP